MTELCKFCNSVVGHHIVQSKAPWDHILFETPNFIVVPTRGAIVEGWVLIVTRTHYLCMGALENELVSELRELCGLVCAALQECYGPVRIFENGPTKPKQAVGCGVDHAHLHALPTDFNLIEGIQDICGHSLQWIPANGIQDAVELHERGLPYLYVEQPTGEAYLTTRPDFESQLFRRAIATYYGRPDCYDWRVFPEEDNVRLTVERLETWSYSNGQNILQQRVALL